MKQKCAKCKELVNDGFWHINHTVRKKFLCDFCHKFLENHPSKKLREWLKETGKVSENIRKAHRARLEGNSSWQSQQLDSSKREDYPEGSIWQDDSSLKDDGKVDFYVKNDKWIFLHKETPLNFLGRCGTRNSRETD